MTEEAEAQKAIENLHQSLLQERELVVNVARPRDPERTKKFSE